MATNTSKKKQSSETANNRTLKSRALSTLVIDHSTRVTASKHGRQKLDADDYSHDQIAESELVTNE